MTSPAAPNGTTCGNTAEVTNSQLQRSRIPATTSTCRRPWSASLYVYNPYFDPCETDVNGNSYTLDIDWNFGAYGTCGSTKTKMKLYYELQAAWQRPWTTPESSELQDGGQPDQPVHQARRPRHPGHLAAQHLIRPDHLVGRYPRARTSPDTQSFGTHVYSLLRYQTPAGQRPCRSPRIPTRGTPAARSPTRGVSQHLRRPERWWRRGGDRRPNRARRAPPPIWPASRPRPSATTYSSSSGARHARPVHPDPGRHRDATPELL